MNISFDNKIKKSGSEILARVDRLELETEARKMGMIYPEDAKVMEIFKDDKESQKDDEKELEDDDSKEDKKSESKKGEKDD